MLDVNTGQQLYIYMNTPVCIHPSILVSELYIHLCLIHSPTMYPTTSWLWLWPVVSLQPNMNVWKCDVCMHMQVCIPVHMCDVWSRNKNPRSKPDLSYCTRSHPDRGGAGGGVSKKLDREKERLELAN